MSRLLIPQNRVIQKRKKCWSLQKAAIKSLRRQEEYGCQSSIHGVKYTTDKKLHLIERCIWAASVTLCTAAAAVLVYTSLQKFYNNPTITTIDSFTNETKELPFPAVTFCNINLIFESKARKILKNLKIPEYFNLTREWLSEILPNVGILIRPDRKLEQSVLHQLHILEDLFDFNNLTTPQAVKTLSQSCHNMVERCSWDGAIFDCNPRFKKRATFNGYCCSFNYDFYSNWSGHPDVDPYKQRSSRYGPGSGLRVLLNPMKREYLWGSFVSTGFSVVVHRAGLYPEGSRIFVSPKSETFIRVSPEFIDGDSNLKSVRPTRRLCTFYNERHLSTSRTYSREACVLQCRSIAVRNLCGCVPFHFMKQVTVIENKKKFTLDSLDDHALVPCSMRHLSCLKRHLREIESEETIDKCECWPQCTLLYYGVSLTAAKLDAMDYYVGDFYEGTNTTGRASVNVYFTSQVAQQSKKDIIYSVEQLMAKLGGIFSLFLGCSFLTAMEIVYSSILRIVVLFGLFGKNCAR